MSKKLANLVVNVAMLCSLLLGSLAPVAQLGINAVQAQDNSAELS